MTAPKDDSRVRVKQEESFVTSVKKALIADGWKPPNASGKSIPRHVKQNSQYYKGKKNPLGPDGKPPKMF